MPLVMGILNVTPDSFSDGGRYLDLDSAVAHGVEMLAEGADLLDVGGESTRPGATPVSIDAELCRVVPVIEALALTGARVSVDTRRGEVARAAIDAGASIINDISASLWDVAAERDAGWIAMHMAGEPATMQRDPHYLDVVSEVCEFLVDRAERGRAAGVGSIWIDPGFGFGKTARHNIELVASIGEFVATGVPVAVGISRKATLGELAARFDTRRGARTVESGGIEAVVCGDSTTGVYDRLEPGLAMATWSMWSGVAMVRVHDVRAHVRAARVVAGSIPSAVASAA